MSLKKNETHLTPIKDYVSSPKHAYCKLCLKYNEKIATASIIFIHNLALDVCTFHSWLIEVNSKFNLETYKSGYNLKGYKEYRQYLKEEHLAGLNDKLTQPSKSVMLMELIRWANGTKEALESYENI